MSVVESNTEPKSKKARRDESEMEGKEDRISDLPDSILVSILSFLKCRDAVQTCIVSRRWKELWENLPSLTLHSSDFSSITTYNKFVRKVLSKRNGSVALRTLDFQRRGITDPRLLKRVLSYATTHNVRHLGIEVQCDIGHLPRTVLSCKNLTSLKLSVYARRLPRCRTSFPKSLDLPTLTSLHLEHFIFVASENGQAEPFSGCKRLNSLVLYECTLSDPKVLCISSATLSSLTIHPSCCDFHEIMLSSPNLRSLAFRGYPFQDFSGSNISSVEQVHIDAMTMSPDSKSPVYLLSWLLGLTNLQSLTVTANTLQVLFLIPGLLEMKLPFLCNLKSLKVKMELMSDVNAVYLVDKMRRYPAVVPDGMVTFLRQNSPSAEVVFIKC